MICYLNSGTPTKQGSSRMSPTLSGDSYSDRQFVAITSEKYARVIALPSQNCVYRQQIVDTDYVVKAEVISLKGKQIDVLILEYELSMTNIIVCRFEPFMNLQTVFV